MGEGDIDSTQVRIFSNGTTLSKHKNLARYTKLQYQEEILPSATVPMQISIMSAEDRTGRGGDHIPFRENGFTAIRFTSANENGNAQIKYDTYRIGTRVDGNEFDSLYTITGTNEALIDNPAENGFFFVTACVVDDLGVESIFAEEQFLLINSTEDLLQTLPQTHVRLLPNRPNPFDEATTISWHVDRSIPHQSAQIQVHSSNGQLIKEKDISLNLGISEWVFTHGWGTEGIYYYSLVIDGRVVETRSMVFAY